MDVAIQIPNDVGRALAGRGADVARAVLEAVAVSAYRSGIISPAHVQEMLGLGSRWETEEFLCRSGAHTDYTAEELSRDITAVREATR